MKLTITFFILITFVGFAQNTNSNTIEQSRIDYLISEQQKISQERKTRILNFKKRKNNKNDHRKINDVIDNIPIYIENHNTKAATATRTNYLQPGGDLNLNLQGENMFIGIWELGGIAKIDHVEFLNIENKLIKSDKEENDPDSHATHVTGTILATGIRTDARGMAPLASAYLYGVNDDSDEALTLGQEKSILVSNHSYGVPISNIDNFLWLPGKYNTDAREWDLITNILPFYLPVFSAGNDGDVEFNDGILSGYGKLTGEKNAKNTLVIGSANNQRINFDDEGELTRSLFGGNPNIVSSFSSQGPTDDLRIKPDLLGMGQTVLSSSMTEDDEGNFTDTYETKQGTSMAAPNVAGTILLLQELYFNLNSRYMKASSVKSLLCTTASDVGAVGPDIINGWGLVNAKKAGEIILNNNLIFEKILTTNESSFKLKFENPVEQELSIGIVWNDPAGISESGNINNTESRLVNNLDIKLEKSSGEIFHPWMLNKDDLLGSAIKGINNRDNVEIINVKPLQVGNYEITVDFQGSLLNDNQTFSLVISNPNIISLSNETFNPKSISFWPNPVKNNLNITSSEIKFSGDAKVSIYDITGREILSLSDFNNPNALNIDVSTLSNGVYIVNLTDGQHSIQSRIIKE